MKHGQCTDHMNQSGGGNASGGQGKSPTHGQSQAFRSGRDSDNNDYQRNIPHGSTKRRS